MSTPNSKSKWTSRMGGAMRRASSVLINPRPSTPSAEREPRTSSSTDRDEDVISIKRRSRSNTSLSNLGRVDTSTSPTPSVQQQPAAQQAHQPSPIAESPAREAEAAAEESSAAVPVPDGGGAGAGSGPALSRSPLSQEITSTVESQLQPGAPTSGVASPVDYIPPPTIDNTAAGPGAFLDDLDDLPKPSNPIPDPFVQAARVEATTGEGHQQPSSVVVEEELVKTQPVTPEPPASPEEPARTLEEQVELPPVETTTIQPTVTAEPAPIFPAAETGQQQQEAVVDHPRALTPGTGAGADPAPTSSSRAVPMPFPQPRGTFFDDVRASPEPVEHQHDPSVGYQGMPDYEIAMPVPVPAQAQAYEEAAATFPDPDPVPAPAPAPQTPPQQMHRDLGQHDTSVGGQGTWTVTETPMTMPSVGNGHAAASLHSTDSSMIVTTERQMRDPFAEPVVPRIPPFTQVVEPGNGYLPASHHEEAMRPFPSMPMPLGSGMSNPMSVSSQSSSDESQPLLNKAQKTSYTFNPSMPISVRHSTQSAQSTHFHQHQHQHQHHHPHRLQQQGQQYQFVFDNPHQTGAAPLRLRELGWIEFHLPDASVYYVHPAQRIVADVELRSERLLDAVMKHLSSEQHERSVEAAPGGGTAELWLRDGGNGKRGFVPVRWWVDHEERTVMVDKTFEVVGKRKLKKKRVEEDQLDLEYRYWAYVEAHPSHIVLPTRAKQEAFEAINWAMADRLLPLQSPAPAPFSQEECATLLDLLRRFDKKDRGSNLQIDMGIQTRTIARVLIRVVQWRQQHYRPNKPLPLDATPKYAKAPIHRRHFPRVIIDFMISCLCLGIPFFFLDRTREHRLDEESGMRSAAPMFVIGACTCIMAAIVLSASVTFLTLQGLDSVMRIASFVAIVSAICSMASTLLAIFTIKADLERPPQVIGGEGLLMLSRRSVVMSLPVVFLLYSIIGFVTGVVLYSLRGATITTDANGFGRKPFSEYARWTAAGALGAIAGMVTVTVLLFKR
ncbi:hypothetical protein AX17_004430 [Amanita inopinata Kibby_2008]|nr:hypothetical protein AX17_004430 [Amanita inopinata Kibby_2008]